MLESSSNIYYVILWILQKTLAGDRDVVDNIVEEEVSWGVAVELEEEGVAVELEEEGVAVGLEEEGVAVELEEEGVAVGLEEEGVVVGLEDEGAVVGLEEERSLSQCLTRRRIVVYFPLLNLCHVLSRAITKEDLFLLKPDSASFG
jgi:hypothetical protein